MNVSSSSVVNGVACTSVYLLRNVYSVLNFTIHSLIFWFVVVNSLWQLHATMNTAKSSFAAFIWEVDIVYFEMNIE